MLRRKVEVSRNFIAELSYTEFAFYSTLLVLVILEMIIVVLKIYKLRSALFTRHFHLGWVIHLDMFIIKFETVDLFVTYKADEFLVG